jgi:hypothetical protein
MSIANRGPGGVATAGRPPPAAPLARQGNSPGRVIPGTECKKYKINK